MGQLAKILQLRCPVVHPLGPETTVAAAVAVMSESGIGIVPILENGRLVGVFSERDLLRRVVACGRDAAKTRLLEVMTPDPVTADPGDDPRLAVLKMRQVGCRHLPIVAAGQVIDMLSMRDLLTVEIEERSEEIVELKRYIHGS